MNKRMQKNKRDSGEDLEWLEWLNKCDDMLMDPDYDWAEETIEGIRGWIKDHEHVTENQKESITNIEERGKKDWD